MTHMHPHSIICLMDHADFSLIYQDHYLLLVNKAAGVVVHPTYKHPDGTMWDALLTYSQQLGQDDWRPPELPDEPEWAQAPAPVRAMLRARREERLWQEEGLLPRPCLLHRLDRDTSGIVALARTERSRRHMIQQFHEHTIVKRYLAVVQKGAFPWTRPRVPLQVTRRLQSGEQLSLPAHEIPFSFSSFVVGTEFVLDGPLQRDPDERRRSIVGADGQPASTIVRTLAVEPELHYALLEVQPVTGRTHQIRAHLAALGFPIVGDTTYTSPGEATPGERRLLARQFLHAFSLQFRRYPDNELCAFTAPLPSDLLQWLSFTRLLQEAFEAYTSSSFSPHTL